MGTVYNLPKNIEPPVYKWSEGRDVNQAIEDKFISEVKDFCLKRSPNKEYVGETIQFPAADGYAVYMIANLSPVELIHLPIGDAWEFQYANRITKADIIEKLKAEKRMQEFLKKEEKNNG